MAQECPICTIFLSVPKGVVAKSFFNLFCCNSFKLFFKEVYKLQGDFSQGKVWKNILSMSAPLILAQVVQLLYNVVDRIYIGHLPENGSMALTGIGLVFPIVSLVTAFTNLFGTGAASLFAIARGSGDNQRAQKILCQTVTLLAAASVVVFLGFYLFRKPVLFLFGASTESYVFANEYLRIYLFGTFFIMLSTGLNGFINAQGFPKTGMFTIIIGAILNLILDPIFIFVFKMGVRGAAVATVISQGVSCLWVILFLLGKRNVYKLKYEYMRVEPALLKEIVMLGFAGFIMQGTNCVVQAVCNTTLGRYGGDLMVGVMTVITSVRDILLVPILAFSQGAQPVLGYNYGAEKYSRVKTGIRFVTVISIIYSFVAWGATMLFPKFLLSMFSNDSQMIYAGTKALAIYFCGFFMMAFQSAGQSTFTALGCAKRAIIFSLLRKIVIVVPLSLILPTLGLMADGVFWAEPISNAIGGAACYITMFFTLYRRMPKKDGVPPQKREA